MRYDAIVLGAGPAGATTALVLARAGFSVAIVEKAAFPRRKVCGEFMSATNAPLFAELGLTRAIASMAGPEIHRVGLFACGAMVTAPMPKAKGVGWGRALGRDRLDALLLDRATEAGAVCWQPWGAVGFRREAGSGFCTIAHNGEEREISAPIMVAAHGSWERGGLPTQLSRPHGPSDLLGFKAHFRSARLAPDLMPLLVFPGGYGGMVTSNDGLVSLTCCIRRDVLKAARRDSGTAAQAVLRHLTASCRGVAETLEGAVLQGSWLAAGPLNPGIRPRYADGIFRAGNLAGEAHPIVAEGISMAMQSGWLLARHLIAASSTAKAGHGLDSLGAAYAADWSRAFSPRIRAAALFAELGQRPAAVSLLLPIVRRLPALLTFGASLSGKTQLASPGPLGQRPC